MALLTAVVTPQAAFAQGAGAHPPRANVITPDGRTQTRLQVSGNTTTITTGTLSGANAFNSFGQFVVGTGNTVNLMVPNGAANLVNLVHNGPTEIYGVLNSYKNGKIGGNVYFADPYGFFVGASGVVNVGALSVSTPTGDFLNRMIGPQGAVNADAVGQFMAGDYPVSPDGLISIRGKVNAQEKVRLQGQVVKVGAPGVVSVQAAQQQALFASTVNTAGLQAGAGIRESGGTIEIVAAGDAKVAGTLTADGASGINGGTIDVQAGHNVAVASTAHLSAKGKGQNSSGGKVRVYAGNDLAVQSGAHFDASAGTTGDGGTIEASAHGNAILGSAIFDASAVNGHAGRVLFDPANLTVSGNIASNGADIALAADDAITLDAGIKIDSTLSGGNAGNITLTAPDITISGTIDASASADGAKAGNITLQTPSGNTQSATFTVNSGALLNAQATGKGGTSGTITLSALSDPSSTVTTGFNFGTVQASTAITVNGMIQGGDITLDSEATLKPSNGGSADASSSVLVGGTLKGQNVTLKAITDAETTNIVDITSVIDAASNYAVGGALPLPEGLPGNSVGYVEASGISTVKALSGASIQAAGNAVLDATTTESATTPSNISGALLGAIAGKLTGTATAQIASGASVRTGGDLDVKAHNTATLSINALTNTQVSPVDLTLAASIANVNATATIATGATINAAGNVSVIARNDNSFTTTATAYDGGRGKVGLAAAVADINTDALAIEGADLGDGTVSTTTPQSLLVEADSITTTDSAFALTAVGGQSSTQNQLTGSGALSDLETNLFNTYLTKGPLSNTSSSSETPKIGSAVAVSIVNQTAESGIRAYPTINVDSGATSAPTAPTVQAAQQVAVYSQMQDAGLQSLAESQINSADEPSPDNPNATIAVSVAAAIGLYTHNDIAYIGPNVSVTAPDIGVAADFSIPMNDGWSQIPGGFPAPDFSSASSFGTTLSTWASSLGSLLGNVLNSNSLGFANNTLTSYANALGDSTKAGVYGAVNYLQFDNTTGAWVGDGAKVTSKGGQSNWTTSIDAGDSDLDSNDTGGNVDSITWASPVTVRASSTITTINVAGNLQALNLSGTGGSDSSTTVGGAVNLMNFTDTTIAGIANGAQINITGGDLTVSATGSQFDVTVTPSSGDGGGVAINGTAGVLLLNNTVHASISSGATISVDDAVNVAATENLSLWTVSGAASSGKTAGVGIGVALNDLATDTKAYIADNSSDAALLAASAPGSDGGNDLAGSDGSIAANDEKVTAQTNGTIAALAIAGAKQGNNEGGNSDVFSKLSSKSGDLSELVQNIGDPGDALFNAALEKLSSKGSSTDTGTGSQGGDNTAGDAESSKSSVGLGISGSASVNITSLGTEAYIDSAKITKGATTVSATNNMTRVSGSGAASLVLAGKSGSNTSAGVAGAVAYDKSGNNTLAWVSNSTITNSTGLTVEALTGGLEVDVGLGLAVNTNSNKAASVSISATVAQINDATNAYIENTLASGTGAVQVVAYDNTTIGLGGGSFFGGGNAGVGAGLTLALIGDGSLSGNTIDATSAYVDHSSLTGFDSITVDAADPGRVISAAAMGGGGANTNAFAFGVVYDQIGRTTNAAISHSTITVNNGITVEASDNNDSALDASLTTGDPSLDENFSGQTSAQSGQPSVFDVNANGAGILAVAGMVLVGKNAGGIEFAGGMIKDTISASVSDSHLTSSDKGAVQVTADSGAIIMAASIGVAVSTTGQFAGAGSVTANIVDNTVSATVGGPGDMSSISAGSLKVEADDNSTIQSLAGAISVSVEGNAVGAAVSFGQIGRTITASATDVALTNTDSVQVGSKATGTIQTLAVAGSAAGGNVAVAGSVTVNIIGDQLTSDLEGVSLNDTASVVGVTSSDTAEIDSLAGDLAGSGTAAIGVAVAVNDIGGGVTAELLGGDNHAIVAKDVMVAGTVGGTINTIATGLAISGDAGVSGSIVTNIVNTQIVARIDQGARVTAQDNVGVIAATTDGINAIAGAVGIGGSAVGAGVTVAVNDIQDSTQAWIAGGSQVAALALDPNDYLTVNDGSLNVNGQPQTFVDVSNISHAADYLTVLGELHGPHTKNVTGIAVNASSEQNTGVAAVTAALSFDIGSVSLAANVVTNLMGGTTAAYISDATINPASAGTAGAAQQVDVTASSHAFGADVVLGLSGSGGFSGTGAVNVNLFNRSTSAYIAGGTVNAAAGVDVDAVSSQDQASIAMGLAVGVGGVAATGIVTQFDADTTADVDGGSITTGSLSVDSQTENGMNAIGGAGALGGIAVGAAFVVGINSDTTLAYVGDEPTVTNPDATSPPQATSLQLGGNLTVDASTTTTLDSAAVGGSGAGATAIAGMVNVNLLSNTTRAGLYAVSLNQPPVGKTTATPAGNVNVQAVDNIIIKPIAGALAVGLSGAGVGAGANIVVAHSQAVAEIVNSSINAAAVDVSAQSNKYIQVITTTAGVGGTAGIGGSAAVILLGDGIGDAGDSSDSASNELANSSNGGTLGAVNSFTSSTNPGSSDPSLGISQQSSINQATDTSVSAPVSAASADGPTARILGGTITTVGTTNTPGSVSVQAIDHTSTQNIVGALGLGGVVGLGASVGFTRVDDHVAASINGAAVTAGSILVGASQGDGPQGSTAEIDSFVGGGGLVGLGISVADAVVNDNVTATLGGTITGNSSGNATVSASDGSTVKAAGFGGAIGLGAALGVVSLSSKTSSVTADIAPSAGVTQYAGVSVQASDQGPVSAYSLGASGGILSGDAADATATDQATVTADVGAGSTILFGDGGLLVSATDIPSVWADAVGYSVGGASIGASIATATATPIVKAYLDSNTTVNGSGLVSVVAQTTLPSSSFVAIDIPGTSTELADNSGCSGPTSACAEATAGTGGLLFGANATVAQATDDAQVSSYTGTGVTLSTGAMFISATNNTSQYANAYGIAIGGLAAVGADFASATSDGSATAYLGANAANPVSGTPGNLKVLAAGDLTIQAGGTDTNIAVTTAGSGGVVAGDAATATTENRSTTSASIQGGNSQPILVGALTIQASHGSNYDSEADSTQAGVLDASGSTTSDTVTPNTSAGVGGGANVQATSVFISASNNVQRVNSGNYDVQAAGGGVATGSAADQETYIATTAIAFIGQNAIVDVVGNIEQPGSFVINAQNNVSATGKAKIDTGGALDGAFAKSNLVVIETAQVNFGSGAKVDSIGNLSAYAENTGTVNAEADVHTYGAVGFSDAGSYATLDGAQTINIGNDGGTSPVLLHADGDIALMAGSASNGASNVQSASANTSVFNYTAVPIDTPPDANAAVLSQSNVNIGANATVLAGGDVTLSSIKGTLTATGSSVDQNTYEKVIEEIINFFLSIFHKQVTIDVTGGSGTTAGSFGAVNVSGLVAGGADYQQRLTINPGSNGQPIFTIQDPGTAYTVFGPYDLIDTLKTQAQNLTTEVNALIAENSSNTDQITLLNSQIKQLNQQISTLSQYTDADAIPLLILNNMKAQAGGVHVTADVVTGGGTLEAHGDPYIDIENNSPYSLQVNDLTIGAATGVVSVNGVFQGNGATLSGGLGPHVSVVNGPSSVATVTVNQNYSPTDPNTTPPYIFLEGRISNPEGSVTIANASGSIVQDGTITAQTVTIFAPKGDFVQNYSTGFSFIGGTPPLDPNVRPSEILVGGSVYIAAQYLDINGTIESGYPDWALTLDPNMSVSAANDPTYSQYSSVSTNNLSANGTTLSGLIGFFQNLYKNSSQSSPTTQFQLLGPTVSNPGLLDAFYDAKNNQIVVTPESIQSGNIYLFGNIFSTGGGHLYASSGYGRINVTNETNYALVLDNLSTGTGRNGQIEIADTAQVGNIDGSKRAWPLVTLYEYDWKTQTISEFQNLGSTDQDQPLVQVTPTTIGNSYTTSYTPAGGGPSGNGAWYIPPSSSSTTSANPLIQAYIDLFKALDALGFQFGNLLNALEGQMVSNPATLVRPSSSSYTPPSNAIYAAYPIDIEFNHEFNGASPAEVSITSTAPGANVVLAGGINNPVGTIKIESNGSILQSAVGATANAVQVSLKADGGSIGVIGQSVGVNITDGGVPQAQELFGTGASGLLAAAQGSVNIVAPLDGLPLYSVTSTNGDVALQAQGDIRAASPSLTPTVIGNNIDLVSLGGGIGSLGSPLVIQSNVSGATTHPGELDAQASQGIYLTQPSGTIYLGQVQSFGGDVVLAAQNGSIVNNIVSGQIDQATMQHLQQLWSSLNLIYDPTVETQQQADQNLGTNSVQDFNILVSRNYQEYWQLNRFASNGQIALTPQQAAFFEPQVVAYFKSLNKSYSGTPTTAQITSYVQGQYSYLQGFFQGLYTGVQPGQVGQPGEANLPTSAFQQNYSYDPMTTRNAVTSQDLAAIQAGYQEYWNIRQHGSFNADGSVSLNGQDVTAQYNYLQGYFHGLYNNALPADSFTGFNAQYTYAAPTDVKDQYSIGAAWTKAQLTNAINANALTATANTQIFLQPPNVIGQNIDLEASAGAIGSIGAPDVFTLSPQVATLPADLIVDLAAAAPGDVQISSPDAQGNYTITVLKAKAVNLQANGSGNGSPGTVTAHAEGNIYLGGSGSVALGDVSNAGGSGQIRLAMGGSILSANPGAAVISGASKGLDLEAAGTGVVNASIGTAQDPLVIDISGNLDTARAAGGIYLTQAPGDLVLGNVFAGGAIVFTATGGSILSEFDDFGQNIVHIQGASLDLEAPQGGIGVSLDPNATRSSQLHIALANNSQLAAHAGGNIDILNPDAAVAAGQGIVIGPSGITAGGSLNLDVETGNLTMPIGSKMTAGQGISLTALGDIILGGLTSNLDGDLAIVVDSKTGAILANGDGQTNLLVEHPNGTASPNARVYLSAANGIGTAAQPIIVDTPWLQAISEPAGSISISVLDDLYPSIIIPGLSASDATISSLGGLTIERVDIGQSLNLAASSIDANLFQFGSTPLVLNVTGYQGTVAQSVTLSINTANLVNFQALAANQAQVTTTSAFLDIQNGDVPGAMSLATPFYPAGGGEVYMDNQNPAEVKAGVQLYQPDGKFFVYLGGTTLFTDANVTHFTDGHQVLVPNWSGNTAFAGGSFELQIGGTLTYTPAGNILSGNGLGEWTNAIFGNTPSYLIRTVQLPPSVSGPSGPAVNTNF
ncbi:MAG TPA: leukotoxin LktA family filamentous adhesin [Alphaproteobacteria bacterium]|nr:leukotoxin LktA family filamentous adhesin [Alphaproteobacteria bacterium]